ncbi:MAG TPA: hypothetical protein VGR76_17750, partial [Candidatus Angelobacter sp.]|nr:hypothetical protein [Candidatus Angelobacter sp.]
GGRWASNASRQGVGLHSLYKARDLRRAKRCEETPINSKTFETQKTEEAEGVGKAFSLSACDFSKKEAAARFCAGLSILFSFIIRYP